MNKFFIINYLNLVTLCEKLSEEDPQRTYTDLDLLCENIKKKNLAIEFNGIIPVEIDYRNIRITLLGEPFPNSFNTMDNFECYSYEDRVIQHFSNAMEVSEELNFKDEIFKLIN